MQRAEASRGFDGNCPVHSRVGGGSGDVVGGRVRAELDDGNELEDREPTLPVNLASTPAAAVTTDGGSLVDEVKPAYNGVGGGDFVIAATEIALCHGVVTRT